MPDTKPRKIAVYTSSRAEYGHLYWLLKALEQEPSIELQLLVGGAHVSPTFGQTIEEIYQDGFKINAISENLLSSDSDVGMAKTIGLTTLSLADQLGALRPDLIIIIADRYEMLAPATVALSLRIPIAHIEGGDISEGAIDDAVRNALTKMGHLHFTPTHEAKQRVLAMGEEPWRVHFSGAPSLDHLINSEIPDKQALYDYLQLNLDKAPIVIAWHPVTLHQDTCDESEALYQALETMAVQDNDRAIIFCFPNADAGSHQIMQMTKTFCEKHNARLYTNLNHLYYWSLLKVAQVLIGNSSSGIMETASIKLPTIDIGDRQLGRTKADNIISVAANKQAIIDAYHKSSSEAFKASLAGLENPYGDGNAAKRIVEVLKQQPFDQSLLHKKSTP